MMEVVQCSCLPLIVQRGGHGVECRADRLGAVPYEEQLCQSFLGTLCCEAGLCVLVPTVLHRLFQRANRLEETVLIFNYMGNFNNINTDHSRNWILFPICYTEIGLGRDLLPASTDRRNNYSQYVSIVYKQCNKTSWCGHTLSTYSRIWTQ